MPSFENFIEHLDSSTNLINIDTIDEYYNYLEISEFNNNFEEKVARELGGYILEINHPYYKPIKYNDYYIILDWSIYINEDDMEVGDILIKGYKNIDDLMNKLNE